MDAASDGGEVAARSWRSKARASISWKVGSFGGSGTPVVLHSLHELQLQVKK